MKKNKPVEQEAGHLKERRQKREKKNPLGRKEEKGKKKEGRKEGRKEEKIRKTFVDMKQGIWFREETIITLSRICWEAEEMMTRADTHSLEFTVLTTLSILPSLKYRL